MNRYIMRTEEYQHSESIYTIHFDNAFLDKNIFYKIVKLISYFSKDSEMYFGFWREDGVNITYKQFKEYRKEIPDFFSEYGSIKKLDEYLSIAKIGTKYIFEKQLYAILNFYLDICFFIPKVDFETFEEFFLHYMKNSLNDYILCNITDLIFHYYDSGDFSISFNTKIYDPIEVQRILDNILEE